MIDNGIFVISLDFELHWGRFDKMQLNASAQKYFFNTRNVIPQKLKLFSENEIHVTWAAVGMLFRKNKKEWEEGKPNLLPTFKDENLSAYKWVDKNGFYNDEDPFHFAPSLVDLIKSSPYQEIGTHTYAHYYCLAEGQTAEQFRADMQTAKQAAKEKNIELRSLVFPRNQFNEKYLSICKEEGIYCVRSNPDAWYWNPSDKSALSKKIFRTGDAYINIPPTKVVSSKSLIKNISSPVLLPASRLYRSWQPKYPILNKLKLQRILHEMTNAAKQKAYYHLWWHPHNFGNYPEECLQELKQIIEHYHYLHDKYAFKSLSMYETAVHISERD
ncbi:MAG: polysaccharide deacetylase family protein [Bacteroidota bacterium]